MTEEWWLACSEARKMLESVRNSSSERKLRLFATAVCRRLGWLWDWTAVDGAERFAEGLVSREELIDLGRNAWLNASSMYRHMGPEDVEAGLAFINVATAAQAVESASRAVQTADEIGSGICCGLLREIFGNPFRPVTVSPTVRAWNDGTVVRLTQFAYDNRTLPAGTLDNARLAVLGDALEEAGCTDEQILTHLRSGGEHYRGCFVLDALLGKS